jgi:hypothetical protein
VGPAARIRFANGAPNITLRDADPSAHEVAEMLDGLPDALDRAQLGRQQAMAGETVLLDDLQVS